MKTILFLFFATFSISAFSQIQQNVNKTTGTVPKPITQIDSIRFNTNTNQMEIIQTNGNAENHTISDVINVTFSGQLLGTISTLDCISANNIGSLTAYTTASGVSSTISYTGGDGGIYNGQTVTSTGVTGLLATLTAGTFAVGAGTLTYNITGTPNSNGTANFALNIGGQTCTLSWTVVLPTGVVSSLNCGNATNTGTLIDGTAASGVSSSIPYVGGNGGTHNGQTVTSTGVTGLTATLNPGTFAVSSGTLTYTISGTPAGYGTASFLLDVGGQTCSLTLSVESNGWVSYLDCANASNIGDLFADSVANGVYSSIDYMFGCNCPHNGQTVQSTGVTGLTATLPPGFFLNNGTVIYSISGTPNSGGTASFAINIGGQTCILTRIVTLVATITDLSCGTATNVGTLAAGTAANGVSSSIPYTGGNGGTYSSQSIPSTGVTGLTAELSSGILSNGNGTLNYVISGTPSGNGTASFLIEFGGQSCIISWPVTLVGTISTLSCGSATNSGSLIAYSTVSGVSSSVPYTGGNGGTHNGQTVTSTGVSGLTATLVAGTFAVGSGNLTYTISGTPSGSGTALFALNIGGKNCTLALTVSLPIGTITALNCGTSTPNGTLTSGTTAIGVTVSVPYSGGNGGSYTAQSVTSTGVTGLTATRVAGNLAIGNGSVTYSISGSASFGTASFAISLGGQSCSFTLNVVSLENSYPANTIFCNNLSGQPVHTAIVEVTNPTTGKIWMDRNLGASQVATDYTDANAYGDLYQWGRRSDGHQCRTSNTTLILSSVDQPSHSSFILTSTIPFDWRNPQNNNLWQGVNGVNNPCPIGYRIPTEMELNNERLSWSWNTSVGAFTSILKLPLGGARSDGGTGSYTGVGTNGGCWSSDVNIPGANSRALFYQNNGAGTSGYTRARGISVRCIKN